MSSSTVFRSVDRLGKLRDNLGRLALSQRQQQRSKRQYFTGPPTAFRTNETPCTMIRDANTNLPRIFRKINAAARRVKENEYQDTQ